VLILLLSSLILGAAWLFTAWRSSQDVLPPGLSINGVRMGGMTREQALTAIGLAYTVPISVTYAGSPISPLLPEVIELRLDAAATAENLEEALSVESNLYAFLRYIANQIGRREQEVIEVNAVVQYSRERLNAYLERVAQRYDHPPMEPVLLSEAGTFRPASDGTELDVQASLPLLIGAVLAADPAARQVDLVVEIEPSPDPSTDILKQALDLALEGYPGVVGIFTKDLGSGQELCVNCGVAFSGTGPIGLAIALEAHRADGGAANTGAGALLRAMLSDTDPAATDQILVEIGAGDPYSGAAQITELLLSLGLRNSYILGPSTLATAEPPPDAPVTAANSRIDIAAGPVSYVQTTPMEMGILLEGIYHCAQGGGCLRALYPQALTPLECQELLDLMAGQATMSPLGLSLPATTRVAHQRGSLNDTHADVALIYGPRTDFLVSAFIYLPEQTAAEAADPIFEKIGELVYRFYSGEADTAPQAVMGE